MLSPHSWCGRPSSVRAHLAGRDDPLVRVKPVLRRVGDFGTLIRPDPRDEERFGVLRGLERTGRPLATAECVADLEKRPGRPIACRFPGRKPKPGDHPGLL